MPILKVGDFVEAGGKLTPGVLVDMELKRLGYDIREIDINDPGAKVVSCTVFYEDQPSPYYQGTNTFLSNLKPVSPERYFYMVQIGEELLKTLWWYWKRCEKQLSWGEFTELYYCEPKKVMRYIPIRNILEPNVIEFADGSIWECTKVKYNGTRRESREVKKKHHYYKPINQLYGLRNKKSI